MHRLNFPKKLTLIGSIICTSLFCIFTGCAPKTDTDLSENVHESELCDKILDELSSQALVRTGSSSGKDIYTNGTKADMEADGGSVTLSVPADDYVADKEGYILLSDIEPGDHLILENGIVTRVVSSNGKTRNIEKSSDKDILFIRFTPISRSHYNDTVSKISSNNADEKIADAIGSLVDKNLSDRKDQRVAETASEPPSYATPENTVLSETYTVPSVTSVYTPTPERPSENDPDRETIPSSTISIDPVPDVVPTTSVKPSAKDKNRPEN